MKRSRLNFFRAVFVLEFVMLLAAIAFSRSPMPLSDEILYAGATVLILVALWWKRIYASPAFQRWLFPFLFFILLIASWIRQGRYTAFYGVIVGLLLILMLTPLYSGGGEASNRD